MKYILPQRKLTQVLLGQSTQSAIFDGHLFFVSFTSSKHAIVFHRTKVMLVNVYKQYNL